MDRSAAIAAIVKKTKDYRQGEIPPIDEAHVERWVSQFEEGVQAPILIELSHVLQRSYFSRVEVAKFLAGLAESRKFAGDDPGAFWREANLLEIQQRGDSQRVMNSLFKKILKEKFAVDKYKEAGAGHIYIYIDDGVFSGRRILSDISKWASEDAPNEAKIHIVSIVLHTNSLYYRNQLKTKISATKKNIDVSYWRAIEAVNHPTRVRDSDVLWPTQIPAIPEVKSYMDGLGHAPVLRPSGSTGTLGLFSSEEGRSLLEQEFLISGVKIRGMAPRLPESLRPLGSMPLKTFGFGSLTVTFRNCPNNAPLVFWAGDPWIPLFPRVTNNDTSFKRFMEVLGRESFDEL